MPGVSELAKKFASVIEKAVCKLILLDSKSYRLNQGSNGTCNPAKKIVRPKKSYVDEFKSALGAPNPWTIAPFGSTGGFFDDNSLKFHSNRWQPRFQQRRLCEILFSVLLNGSTGVGLCSAVGGRDPAFYIVLILI